MGQVNRNRAGCGSAGGRVAAAGALLLLSGSAHAYLDPGSGGLLVQLLLGGFAGLVVVVKLYWHRLLVFLRLRQEVNREEEAGEEEATSDPS